MIVSLIKSRRSLVALALGVAAPYVYGACNAKGVLPSDPPSVQRAVPGSFPPPQFGATSTQDVPPPPISGATMSLAADGHTVVVADPDRDRVYIVDVPTRNVTTRILNAGDEPGRGAAGPKLAYVALRGSGELAMIRLADGVVQERRAVCRAPRGVAYDAKASRVHVACADGDIVTFPSEGGGEIARVAVDRDLRDLVVTRSGLLVSRFRGAPILVRSDGSIQKDAHPSSPVNWRMTARSFLVKGDAGAGSGATAPGADEPEVGPITVGQEPSTQVVSTTQGGYGGGGGFEQCKHSIVTTRITFSDGTAGDLPAAVLPVDIATNGREIAVVAAGNGHTKEVGQLFVTTVTGGGTELPVGASPCVAAKAVPLPGQAVAALYDGDDNLIVQSREPAELYLMTPDRARVWKTIPLSAESREDTGHAIFHSNSGGGLACASCHVEGSEDGHVWSFDNIGDRKTPSLLGTTAHTEPFHWDGDMKDMAHLMDQVFVERMSGPRVDAPQLAAMTRWVNELPAPKPLPRDVAAERGANSFAARGCASCHSGPMLTNNATVDVGTHGAFQVPSLVGVGWRTSLMHSGCAPSLFQRFDATCGGAKHGTVDDMSKEELQDLVSYLRTL